MRHVLRAPLVLVAVGAALTAATATAGGSALDTTGGTSAAQADCPQDALPLQPFAVAPASRAALRSQRGRFEELGTRPLVVRSALAEFDEARGGEARRDCGRRVWRRTVVVYLESASAELRRRSPSLSQAV